MGTSNEFGEWYKQALTVLVFLGGFAFTALVLVIGNKSEFYAPFHIWSFVLLPANYYFGLTIVLLACTSLLCLFGAVTLARVSTRSSIDSMQTDAIQLYFYSRVGFVIALFLVVSDGTLVGAVVILLFGLWLNHRYSRFTKESVDKMNTK